MTRTTITMAARTTPTLTLWQPWATFVAIGIKTIETRHWSWGAGGGPADLAIHAAARPAVDVPGWRLVDGRKAIVPPDHLVERLGEKVALPRAAVVAVGSVLGMAAMIGPDEHPPLRTHIVVRDEELTLQLPSGEPQDVTDQYPYGYYSPGRVGWLLSMTNVEKSCPACRGGARGVDAIIGSQPRRFEPSECPLCHGEGHVAPITAKGLQGVWRWRWTTMSES